MERLDDYEKRSQHLKSMTEDELAERFWELADGINIPAY